MKKSDLAVVLLVALMTAVIAVAVADAVPSANAVEQKKKALVPGTLTLDGVELTLKVDAETSKPGKKPVVTVKAVNTGDKPVEMDAQIYMNSMSPASRMSRMGPIPRSVWSESCHISLKPGETRTYELTAKAAVGKGNVVSFGMKAGGKVVGLPGFNALATLRRATRTNAAIAKQMQIARPETAQR